MASAPDPRKSAKARNGWSQRCVALLVSLASLVPLAPARGQGVGDMPIIRDAEVEALLADYTRPIFKAAGINAGAVKVFIINDRSFNAFVANGQKIFINTGALMDAKTPNEIIGVLAHETGHMAGGHLVRLHQELARAQVLAVAGMLLGAGAAVSTMRSNGRGPIGADSTGVAGAVLGPQELVRRSLLAYQRGEEEAADRAAVKYLDATGQSSKGLLSTLQRFEYDSLFMSARIDPYLQSHPLPRERISNLEQVAKTSRFFAATDSAALQARHDLMRAKLFGFVGTAGEVARRYPLSDTSLPAKYARAISAYRFGRLDDALSQIDGLVAAQPANPYFHELKGQVLLESGRATQALAPLRRALALAPEGTPIRVLLGHALVATNATADADEAIKVLSNAAQRDSDNAEAFSYLAMAWDRKGNIPQAQLAAAQAVFEEGKYQEARTQAARAQKAFPTGSPGWLKADDILNYRPPKFD